KTAHKLPDVKIDPDDVATYIMTGGTTGVPKAAMLTHFNCTSNTHQIKLWVFKIKPGAMIVGILPLYHSFAMTVVMNSCVRIGACMMLFPKPPSEDELCQTIQDIGPDDAVIYPGAEILFKRMSEFKDLDKYDIKGKLSVCVSGAGPLHRPVQEAFEKATGARLGEGYGLTEAGPVVSAHPFWGNRKIGTIGLPVPGTEWRIVELDDPKKEIPALTTIEKDGEVVPKSGEIICSGPQIMKGYLNQESDTAADIVEMEGKRWLLTGDIGFMDEHGRVTINDRKKQLIKNKGWSVFPSEVETLMMGHEAVTECAVAGIPDEKAGECIKAWCALKPEYQGKLTAEELMAWAKDNMTFYKVPTYVEIIDEIPKSPIGKVMRRELQEADPIYIAWKEKNAG
ncbi:AMP-binding protein, partial [bacterium]|nr:AMP-binding protein [bacterium]